MQQADGRCGLFGNKPYQGSTIALSQAQISFYEYIAHKLVAVGLLSNE